MDVEIKRFTLEFFQNLKGIYNGNSVIMMLHQFLLDKNTSGKDRFTTTMKGHIFEQLCLYLCLEDRDLGDKYKKGWRIHDKAFPEDIEERLNEKNREILKHRGIGFDLVLLTYDEEIHFAQCKYRGKKQCLVLEKVSNCCNFANICDISPADLLIFTTCPNISGVMTRNIPEIQSFLKSWFITRPEVTWKKAHSLSKDISKDEYHLKISENEKKNKEKEYAKIRAHWSDSKKYHLDSVTKVSKEIADLDRQNPSITSYQGSTPVSPNLALMDDGDKHSAPSEHDNIMVDNSSAQRSTIVSINTSSVSSNNCKTVEEPLNKKRKRDPNWANAAPWTGEQKTFFIRLGREYEDNEKKEKKWDFIKNEFARQYPNSERTKPALTEKWRKMSKGTKKHPISEVDSICSDLNISNSFPHFVCQTRLKTTIPPSHTSVFQQ